MSATLDGVQQMKSQVTATLGHVRPQGATCLVFPDTEEATGPIPVPPTTFYQGSRLTWLLAITCRLRAADYFSSWKRSPVRSQ